MSCSGGVPGIGRSAVHRGQSYALFRTSAKHYTDSPSPEETLVSRYEVAPGRCAVGEKFLCGVFKLPLRSTQLARNSSHLKFC